MSLRAVLLSFGGGGAVSSVNGKTGAVVLNKTDVGLGNVDNTSDANKPVSTAQQTALNAKADLSGAAFTGNISALNLSGTNTGDQTNITGNAGTVTTISGRLAAGQNTSISGAGTANSPYSVNAMSYPTIYTVGNWIQPMIGISSQAGTTMSPNLIYVFPFYVQRAITVSDLGTRVQTAVASSTLQLALYNARADGLPGTVIGNTGDLSGATATTVSGAMGAASTLLPGTLYWMAVNTSISGVAFIAPATSAAFVSAVIGNPTLASIAAASATQSISLSLSQTYGTWPDATASTWTVITNAVRMTLPFLKISALP